MHELPCLSDRKLSELYPAFIRIFTGLDHPYDELLQEVVQGNEGDRVREEGSAIPESSPAYHTVQEPKSPFHGGGGAQKVFVRPKLTFGLFPRAHEKIMRARPDHSYYVHLRGGVKLFAVDLGE